MFRYIVCLRKNHIHIISTTKQNKQVSLTNGWVNGWRTLWI